MMFELVVVFVALSGRIDERAVAPYPSIKACSAAGAEIKANYLRMFDRTPDAFSYRCEPRRG